MLHISLTWWGERKWGRQVLFWQVFSKCFKSSVKIIGILCPRSRFMHFNAFPFTVNSHRDYCIWPISVLGIPILDQSHVKSLCQHCTVFIDHNTNYRASSLWRKLEKQRFSWRRDSAHWILNIQHFPYEGRSSEILRKNLVFLSTICALLQIPER